MRKAGQIVVDEFDPPTVQQRSVGQSRHQDGPAAMIRYADYAARGLFARQRSDAVRNVMVLYVATASNAPAIGPTT